MVDVKVVRVFNDKDINAFTKLGEIIKKPKARAEELIAGGWVEESKDSVKAEEPEPAKEPAPENKAKTITTENIVKAETPAKAKPSTKEEKKFD